MSAPVNVLDVMAKAVPLVASSMRFKEDDGAATASELRKARAAVDELIEATEPFATYSSSNELIRIEVRTASVERLRAALVRVRGAA